jgi:NADPH:quinone reductase-like Zn-dependent oxidoreductase
MEAQTESIAGTEPRTMWAARQIGYGPNAHDVVEVTEVAVPEPAPDQVLIAVAASSVNALDWHYMMGVPYFIRLQAGMRTPKKRPIPGADVAGTVVAVGADVTDLRVGDEVFGDIGAGGFAQYAVARSEVLARRPQSLSLEESATLGVAALTALQGLRDWAGMQPGNRVLINGASGGVGSFAIQIARALGASHITAVCSSVNLETAKALGADRVVNYETEDFTALGETFDVFFDNAGSKSLTRSRRMLARDGVFVMVTGRKGKWIRPVDRMLAGKIRSKLWSQRFVNNTARSNDRDAAFLAELVEEGRLRPVIDRRFDLDDAAAALAYQAEGHAQGKSIVVVS